MAYIISNLLYMFSETGFTQLPEMGSLQFLFIPGMYLSTSGRKQDDYSILLETFQGPIMTPTFVQSVSPIHNQGS